MAYDEALAARLRALLADVPGVSERPMFGGLGFLVDGHLAVSASNGGGLLVRPEPGQVASLVDRPGVGPMEMGARRSAGWLHVAGDVVADDEALRPWVDLALAYVRTLPPKEARG